MENPPKNYYTLIQGDCLEVLSKMKKERVDLVITSPPYFSSYGKYQKGVDYGEPLYTIEDVSKELFRVLKPDGFYCLNLGFGRGNISPLRPYRIVERVTKYGWNCGDVVIWHKANPIPTPNKLTNSYEYIFILTKASKWKFKRKIDYEHNVWEFPIDSEGHGCCAFPEELPKRCIELMSKKGDLVLDPFSGSGTTMKASRDLSRNCIGIEINPKYCEIAKKRIFGKKPLNREVVYKFVRWNT